METFTLGIVFFTMIVSKYHTRHVLRNIYLVLFLLSRTCYDESDLSVFSLALQ